MNTKGPGTALGHEGRQNVLIGLSLVLALVANALHCFQWQDQLDRWEELDERQLAEDVLDIELLLQDGVRNIGAIQDRIAELPENDPRVMKLRGRAAMVAKKWSLAESIFASVSEREPRNLDVRLALCQCRVKQSSMRSFRCLDDVARMIDGGDDSEVTKSRRANIEFLRAEAELAVASASLAKAAEEEESADRDRLRARAFDGLERARNAWLEGLEIKKEVDNPELYGLRGHIEFWAENYQEAGGFYWRAFGWSGRSEYGWKYLDCLEAAGLLEEVLADLRTAVEDSAPRVDPNVERLLEIAEWREERLQKQ